MIAEGASAPDFEAHTEEGQTVSLAELRGHPVLLYFYPKDDTPGCTTQACGLRDVWSELGASGVKVFGVSRDDGESHRAFKEKYSLPFPLLADTERSLGDAFGIENVKDGVPAYKRSTVLISADGTVAKVMPDVDPATHADDVLAALALVS